MLTLSQLGAEILILISRLQQCKICHVLPTRLHGMRPLPSLEGGSHRGAHNEGSRCKAYAEWAFVVGAGSLCARRLTPSSTSSPC